MKKRLSKLEKELLRVCRSNQAGYHQLANAMKTVRAALEAEEFYEKPTPQRKLPVLPTDVEMRAFFAAFDIMKNPQYKIIARFFYDTGCRIDETMHILVNEINFAEKTILIHGKGSKGKGKKDRVVTVSAHVMELLQLHIKNHPEYTWLFENSNTGKPYSARMVQYKFAEARKIAKMTAPANPHNGRHIFLTELKKAGVDNMAAKLQSGHSDDRSLAIYQTLGINQFRPEIDAARNQFWARIS